MSNHSSAPAPSGAEFSGYISDLSQQFDNGVKDLSAQLEAATAAMAGKGATDPAALAKYQRLLAEYNTYRSAQSSVVKTFKELVGETIRKM